MIATRRDSLRRSAARTVPVAALGPGRLTVALLPPAGAASFNARRDAAGTARLGATGNDFTAAATAFALAKEVRQDALRQAGNLGPAR